MQDKQSSSTTPCDLFFRGSRFLNEYLDLVSNICVESGPPNFRSINLGLGSVYGQFKVSLGLVYLGLGLV